MPGKMTRRSLVRKTGKAGASGVLARVLGSSGTQKAALTVERLLAEWRAFFDRWCIERYYQPWEEVYGKRVPEYLRELEHRLGAAGYTLEHFRQAIGLAGIHLEVEMWADALPYTTEMSDYWAHLLRIMTSL